MEGRIGGSVQEQPSTPAVPAAPPAPPPSTRRPRVREVSSRFMSPVASSSSSSSSSSAGDLHLLTSSSPKHHHNHHQPRRSISAQRQRRQLKMADGDENRPAETARSLDSPFPSLHSQHHGGKISKHHHTKPLKENGQRLDTPTPMAVPPSRSRLSQQRFLTASAATRLLRSSGISLSASDDKETSGGQDNNRDNPNASSASDSTDLLPTVSGRNHTKLFNNSTTSPLYRSLSSPLSSCDDSSLFRAIKGSEKVSLSLKNGAGLSLPPMPPNSKPQVDVKKPKKVSGHVEDVHSLKLLHNHYLQWRFANAMAEVKMKAQKAQAERMLYSLGLKMADLNDSVQTKRTELQRLLRVKTLTSIVESQIPRLEEWSALEEDYSISLSEAVQALLNASIRLPLSGNIRVDTKELGEALTVATKLLEGISQHIRSFIPKAEEMEILMSELARVTSRERALIEECGVSLSKTHASQIEECSLRSQLIQYDKNSSSQPQENVSLV